LVTREIVTFADFFTANRWMLQLLLRIIERNVPSFFLLTLAQKGQPGAIGVNVQDSVTGQF
jgi:hypothetical protein